MANKYTGGSDELVSLTDRLVLKSSSKSVSLAEHRSSRNLTDEQLRECGGVVVAKLFSKVMPVNSKGIVEEVWIEGLTARGRQRLSDLNLIVPQYSLSVKATAPLRADPSKDQYMKYRLSFNSFYRPVGRGGEISKFREPWFIWAISDIWPKWGLNVTWYGNRANIDPTPDWQNAIKISLSKLE